MTDKSHVTMEQHICKVCGKIFDTGSILIDRRLNAVFERFTVTGYSLCPDDQKKFDDGYVALVVVSNMPASGNTMQPRNAKPIGVVAHVKRDVARKIFNVSIPDDLEMVYVEPGVITKFEEMMSHGKEGT